MDDEVAALNAVRRNLRLHGFEEVSICSDSREALARIHDENPELVVLDLAMPHVSGGTLLLEIARLLPDLPVIVVTAESGLETAVHCMQQGAADYLLKPVAGERMAATVERVLHQYAVRADYTRMSEGFLSNELAQPEAFAEILTADPAMFRIFQYIEAVAKSAHPVLIVGETGTGKELIARAVHRVSRPKHPFVTVNVAGLDDTLFSDTLFGHGTGAFTGAHKGRAGMIEQAAGGTLFLDEIGDLSEASQVKLLRLLQEGEYFPLGADTPTKLTARVLAATHKDLKVLRKDLYYRLRSYVVKVPPLRDRTEDLPLLVEHFLEQAAKDLGQPKPTVPRELYSYLRAHAWPGNVRELSAMVFDAVARHDQGVMRIGSFLSHVNEVPPEGAGEADGVSFPTPMPAMKALEEAAYEEALARSEGNQSAAAKMLGVSRPTIGRFVARQRSQEDPSPSSSH